MLFFPPAWSVMNYVEIDEIDWKREFEDARIGIAGNDSPARVKGKHRSRRHGWRAYVVSLSMATKHDPVSDSSSPYVSSV